MDYKPDQECASTTEIFTNYKIPKKSDAGENGVASYSTPLQMPQPESNAELWPQPGPVAASLGCKRPLEKEVPKNVTPKTTRPFRETCPELSDPTLPKELTQLFQPLFCKLCQSHLNSNVNAMLHYRSKNHEKKVRRFLIDHAAKTGEPLHKRARTTSEQKTTTDPRHSYCETCDLQLTSNAHAEQHYMGRNHQKALVSKKPAGSGYYDAEGKWHRTLKAKEDASGRFGIGVAFAKPEEPALQQGKFYCTVCNVSTTSGEHLEKHFAGQKHQRALKKLGGMPEAPVYAETLAPVEPVQPPERRDVASCRTPSGQYYCQPCNLSLNSQAQFVQHLDSKKHLRNKAAHAKEAQGGP